MAWMTDLEPFNTIWTPSHVIDESLHALSCPILTDNAI